MRKRIAVLGRPAGRLFYFLISVLIAANVIFANVAQAAGPAKTLISEALFGSKTGAEKKEAALSFVGSALSVTEAITQHEIVDERKFKEGLGKVIDGVVQCLNASAWAKAK